MLLNSRFGRTAEEVVVNELVQGWRRFGLRLITGLFWFFVDLFRRLVQTVERLMYSVDEWLRFRTGDRRAVADRESRFGSLLVLRGLRVAIRRERADRAADQPDQALPGRHRRPQAAARPSISRSPICLQ